MEIEIGRGKTARRAYGFDDIAIVPSRRTRDPRDVDIALVVHLSRQETTASRSRCSPPPWTASSIPRSPSPWASSAVWPS